MSTDDPLQGERLWWCLIGTGCIFVFKMEARRANGPPGQPEPVLAGRILKNELWALACPKRRLSITKLSIIRPVDPRLVRPGVNFWARWREPMRGGVLSLTRVGKSAFSSNRLIFPGVDMFLTRGLEQWVGLFLVKIICNFQTVAN
jgi:hypothetical protein